MSRRARQADVWHSRLTEVALRTRERRLRHAVLPSEWTQWTSEDVRVDGYEPCSAVASKMIFLKKFSLLQVKFLGYVKLKSRLRISLSMIADS